MKSYRFSIIDNYRTLSDEEIFKILEKQEKLERVYHYTSLETFCKLLEGVKNHCLIFHAGSIYTMNDRKEMLLGYEYIKKYLPEVEKKLNVSKDDLLLNMYSDKTKNKNVCDSFGEWMINDDTTNFVISFSAQSDILPMWAMYGDKGAGVCLEFSPYSIKQYYKLLSKPTTVSIEKCRYKEDDIKPFVTNYLEIIYKQFLNTVDKEERKKPLEKAKYLAAMCGLAGTCIKHEGFAYEQEIRMIIFENKKDWKFNPTSDHGLSAYVEAPIPISAITNIIIGPAVDMEKIKDGLKMLLRKWDIKIEPKQSTIPFRLL